MRQPFSRVFGRPLQEVCQTTLPPKVFRQTLGFLARNGLTVPGLFDELRNIRKIQLLHQAYDTEQDPLAAVGVLDSHTVAGVLRLWLSCLPEPLIPWKLAHPVLVLARQLAPPQLAIQLWALLHKIPACNLAVLLPLTEFLHHYNLNHREAGLAAKFVPIFLGSMGLTGELLHDDEDAAVRLVEALITDYRSISLRHSSGPAKLPAAMQSFRSPSPSRRPRRSVRDLSSSSFLPGRYESPAATRGSSRSASPSPSPRQRLRPSSSRKPASNLPTSLPKPPSYAHAEPCKPPQPILPRLHVRTSLASRERTQMASSADWAITEVVGELVKGSTDSLLF
ncbi:hypothetical protein WJX74_009602 [Apatococcus lobatus]|uniref:Rho-GAP domain-containing protein n=1 Tax=Apatococcus lobatus TaxID=904363 RepID=A0AAW1RLU0_9CHLO